MALFGYPPCANAWLAAKQQSAETISPTKRSMAFSLRARRQHGFAASLGCRGLAAQARNRSPRHCVQALRRQAVVQVAKGPYFWGANGRRPDPSVKRFPMEAAARQDVAPATIEATLNYLLDTGEMPSVYTGGPGSTVVRTSSTTDPHRVRMNNGRLEADRFSLDRN